MDDEVFTAQLFIDVVGSVTSPDGQLFIVSAVRPDGEETNLAFPHDVLPALIEHMSVQSVNARDKHGNTPQAENRLSSFTLGTSFDGEAVLGLQVGPVGSINFVLPNDMPEQLMDLLAKFIVQRQPPPPKH